MGNNVHDHRGAEIDLKAYCKRLVGLYFAKVSTKDCLDFNKSLIEFYKENASKLCFEVIFISSDISINDFYKFFADMGRWLAFSYDKKSERVIFGIKFYMVFEKIDALL